MAPAVPGRGYCIIKKNNFKLGVINLQGRVFMPAIDCPFRGAREVIPLIKKETNCILVDIHAEATSEKVAMGFFLDGQVSAVAGTHTHIQTADEKYCPRARHISAMPGCAGLMTR